MQTRTFVAVLTTLGSLVSCAQMEPNHPMNMSQAIQNAKTSADHEALAKRYEDAARSMQAKVQEQKKLFDKYEAESKLYGLQSEKDIFNTHRLRGDDESYFFAKRAEERKAQSQALIRSYEQAVEENMNKAVLHRRMAAETR